MPFGPLASQSVIWNSWLMEGIVPWGLIHCCRSHLLCASRDPCKLKAWQGQLSGEAAAMSKCLADEEVQPSEGAQGQTLNKEGNQKLRKLLLGIGERQLRC